MDGPETDTCESCGAEDDGLVRVQRLYVTPAAWDAEETVTEVEGSELWCVPCRTLYPHRSLSGD